MHKFLTHPRMICAAIAMAFSVPAMSEEAPIVATLAKTAPATSTSSLNIPTSIPAVSTTSASVATAPVVTIPATGVPHVVSAESQMSPQQVSELPRNILLPPATNIITDDPLAVQIKAIDRSDINARITLLAKYARHYPPHFETKRARRAAELEAVDLANTTNSAANGSKPTFEELLQAVKANCLAHNLDVGNDTATNANNFIRSALKLKPNDGEANFLYGVLLSESGGMKEGLPYLNKSAKAGFNESYLSLANAYLSLNQKPKALAALTSYKKVAPDDPHYNDMVDAIKTNKSSIW
jgi:hypothetical protein